MPMSKKDFEAAAWALRYAREDAALTSSDECTVCGGSESHTFHTPAKSCGCEHPEEHHTFVPNMRAVDAVMNTVIIRLSQAFRQSNPRFDAGRFRQWVMSKCILCGGVVKELGDQTCSGCSRTPMKDLEKKHGR